MTEVKEYKYNPYIDGLNLYKFANLTKEEFWKKFGHLSTGEMIRMICYSRDRDLRSIAKIFVRNKIEEVSDGHILWRHSSQSVVRKTLEKLKELDTDEIRRYCEESLVEDELWYLNTLNSLGIESDNPISTPKAFYRVLREDFSINLEADKLVTTIIKAETSEVEV